MSKREASRVEKFCEWCGDPFWVIPTQKANSAKKFCNQSCSAQWRVRQPEWGWHYKTKEYKEARRVAGLRRRGTKNPGAAAHMRANNPMWKKGVKEKALATKERNGTLHVWKGERGGNGTGPTKPQQKILDLLGPKWKAELVICTGRKSPYPHSYKVDIGRRKYKIAVEVDGKAHNWKEGKKKDRKKDSLLKSLGWRVLRFSNSDCLNTPKKVVRIIRSCIA